MRGCAYQIPSAGRWSPTQQVVAGVRTLADAGSIRVFADKKSGRTIGREELPGFSVSPATPSTSMSRARNPKLISSRSSLLLLSDAVSTTTMGALHLM